MLKLTLEPTDDRAKPIFKEAKECEQWLSKLQLTNIQLAHSLLLTEINEFNRFPLPGLERMHTLELLRETVHYVQDEYAKKLSAKPLPLNDHELTIFFAIVQLWRAMSLGYQRCLQAQVAGDRQLAKHSAMLCQRAMNYGGLAIFRHLRTGYEVDGKLWRQLHYLYAFAEAEELLSEKVADPLNKAQPRSTCHDTYLAILLTAHACPAELSRAQLKLLEGWLPQWISLLKLERSYTASRGDAPPLAFDLDGSLYGLQLGRMVKPGEPIRYLPMVPLSKLIRVKTILLQQGKTPKQVDLGELGDSRECIALLTLLHRCWCEDHDMRLAARNQTSRNTLLCCNLESIYAQMTGRAPQQGSAISKGAGENFRLETWHIDNESIQGAQLTRDPAAGGQLSRNQLVALRHDATDKFVLAIAAWVKVIRTGQLRIGVRYLPGEVEAVTLTATGADKEILPKAVPAFLLHVVPTINIPPSLIIPRPWFKPERMVEMLNKNGEKQNVKMGFSVEHGSDFARVSFNAS